MKAIIVAAGPSSRLMPITDEKPKCLLEVGGQTILGRTLEALRENGIKDIAVVRGYRGNLINYSNVTYYQNSDFRKNNILRSLFYAEDEMNDDFIFSYSDILYSWETVFYFWSAMSFAIVLLVVLVYVRSRRGWLVKEQVG